MTLQSFRRRTALHHLTFKLYNPVRRQYFPMEPYPVLQRISRADLRKLLLSENRSNIAVVDVRDSDHVGGHIKGSLHRPSTSLKYEMPALVRELQVKETVVFHCALSQQRGPSSALKYLRERKEMLAKGDVEPYYPSGASKKATVAQSEGDEVAMEEGKASTSEEASKKSGGESKEQIVYVLEGGFQAWQEEYGEDKELTQNYDKKLWSMDWF